MELFGAYVVDCIMLDNSSFISTSFDYEHLRIIDIIILMHFIVLKSYNIITFIYHSYLFFTMYKVLLSMLMCSI